MDIGFENLVYGLGTVEVKTFCGLHRRFIKSQSLRSRNHWLVR